MVIGGIPRCPGMSWNCREWALACRVWGATGRIRRPLNTLCQARDVLITYLPKFTHTSARIHRHIHTCVCIHVQIHTHCIRVHTFTHTHCLYTQMHTHTQATELNVR